MTVTVPDRSLQQRLDALKIANETRVAQAAAKRRIAAGDRKFAARMLASPVGPERGVTTRAFLLAIPMVGETKASKLLIACQISPYKTLGGLNDRQRSMLLGQLRRAGKLP